MRWSEIYERLTEDRNDQQAWNMLESGIRSWARADLWQRGWTLVDDVVAETASDAVLSLRKARGADTFAGFVRGHYLNVRRRALGRVLIPTTSLDGVDPPAWVDEEPDAAQLRVLEACLEALPQRERAAVRLRYFEQAAAERIAAELAVSPGNARRIVFNGLARLRECVRTALPAVA